MAIPQTKQELLIQVKKDKIEYIKCEFIDINGRSVGKLVPVRHLSNLIDNGLYMVNITWFYTPNWTPYTDLQPFGNVLTYPYIDTYTVLTHIKTNKIARIMFYPKEFKVCPRYLLLKQLKKLKDEYGLELYSCFEHEFQLLNQDTKEPLWDGTQYLGLLASSPYQPFLFEMEKNLHKMGVDLEYIMQEFSPGQVETPMKPSWGVKGADTSFTFRNAVKEMAKQKGYMATFATDPFCGTKNGGCNGAHYNFSLWKSKSNDNSDSKENKDDSNDDEKINAFYDENMDNGLSKIARYFLGGMLKYYKELCLLSEPTNNCYRRTNNHSWAPGNATWGYDNRNVMIRVKTKKNNGDTWFEYRNPSSACNPYLLISGVIQAGIDGIKNKIDPNIDDCKDNPMNINSKFMDKKLMILLPNSLENALNCFDDSNYMKQSFSNQFTKCYIGTKRVEIQELKTKINERNPDKISPTDIETNMYIDL